jgi:exopolysaccharide biosynthesis polyprenyl glycosylphosphotransferase
MIRLFRVSVPSSVLLLMVGDLILLVLCYVIPAQWAQEFPLSMYLWDDDGALSIGLVILVMLAGLYLGDLYENFRKQYTSLIVQQLCVVLGVELLLQSLLSYVRSPLVVSKWLMLYGGASVIIVLPLWRRMFMNFVARRLGAATVLFVGSSPIVREIVHELTERPELGLRVVGYVDDERDAEVEALGLQCRGSIAQLAQAAEEQKPERIIVDVQAGHNSRFPVESLLDQQFSGRPIERSANTYETIFGRVSIQSLRAEDLIFSFELGPKHTTVLLQNLYSFILAVIGAVITLPIMLIVALLVRVTSPGPVLFRQTRVGKNKRPFTLYKFRSMRADAEAKTGAVWATKGDPRITSIGGILRKLRLDELPQFINVIRGDMSLVGPRPERPEFVEILEDKIPFFRQRMSVKPGITGWAQINHKYGDTLEDTVTKLEYDLYYIKNLTPSLDAYIIFHTVKVMLLSRGAQ